MVSLGSQHGRPDRNHVGDHAAAPRAAVWCSVRLCCEPRIISIPACGVWRDRWAGSFHAGVAVRLDFGGISRDPQRVAQFQADPLVFHGRFPLRTVAEILRVTRFASEQRAAVRLPLLVLHGAADRLCDPAASRDLCTHAAAGDKTLCLYEGLYHDVLREPEAEQVLADLIAWLDRRC